VNNVLLVTGASRGIGAAIARLAGARGYDVAVNYLKDEKAAGTVVQAVRGAGRRAIAVQGDMARESDIDRMFAATDKELGRLTHLVYNAGTTGGNSRVEAVETKTVRDAMELNVVGALLCAKAAILRMSKKLAGDGIRVNAVSPGIILTDIHPPGRVERIAPTVPMQRAGTAEEVAETVLFLLSDAASYTTGTNVRVAGGR